MDVVPGDRAANCCGLMRPTGVDNRAGKGLVIVHECVVCGFIRPNRIASDSVQGDDIDAVIALMTGQT